MTTILTERGPAELAGARVDGDDLWLGADQIEPATGWTLEPEGFCRADVCVPLSPDQRSTWVSADQLNLSALWRHLRKPVLRSADGETWLLGESAAVRSASLDSLQAPDFSLPDLDGKLHSLSEQRGKKVLLVTWASW